MKRDKRLELVMLNDTFNYLINKISLKESELDDMKNDLSECRLRLRELDKEPRT